MVEGAKDRHGSNALLHRRLSAMDRHGLHAPPCYAKPESADTFTSIDFFHSSADAVNEKPLKSPVDHTLAHRHEMRAPSSAMSSHNPFMQSDVNRLEGTAMNMIKSWHPFQSFRGYFSGNSALKGKSSDMHNISKDYSSVSGSSKLLLPFKSSGLLEASSDLASNMRDSVLNFRLGELDGIPAFPALTLPGKAVNSALSSINSAVMEVKQAYGTSTEAVQNVKRRLVDAFSSYFQNQKRKIDKVADNSSSQRGIVADGNAGSTRTAMLTSAHFIQSESNPSSPPSTATTSQNGRVVVHLRSRL